MAVEAIGNTLSNPESNVQQSSLGQDDLFKILLAQLSYQDPMKPLDNQEFIAQLAQFSNLDQSQQANDKIDSLITMQASNQAIQLLGLTVQVQQEGDSVIGSVESINYEEGSPVLTIKQDTGELLYNIRLSQVSIIR